jgi:hypothetical protein
MRASGGRAGLGLGLGGVKTGRCRLRRDWGPKPMASAEAVCMMLCLYEQCQLVLKRRKNQVTVVCGNQIGTNTVEREIMNNVGNLVSSRCHTRA